MLIKVSTIRLLYLLENYNFEADYLAENWDPLQGPTHSLTPLSILTQRGQNVSLDLLWHYSKPRMQASLSWSGFGYCWILQRVGQPFRTWLRFNGF